MLKNFFFLCRIVLKSNPNESDESKVAMVTWYSLGDLKATNNKWDIEGTWQNINVELKDSILTKKM